MVFLSLFSHCFQCHLNFPNFKSFLEPQQNDGAGTWPDRGRPITKLKLPAFEIVFGSNLFDEFWPQTLKRKLLAISQNYLFAILLIDFHKKKEDIQLPVKIIFIIQKVFCAILKDKKQKGIPRFRPQLQYIECH